MAIWVSICDEDGLALVRVDGGGELLQQRIDPLTFGADDRVEGIAQEVQQEEIGLAETGEPEEGEGSSVIDRPGLHERGEVFLHDLDFDTDLGQLLAHQLGHRDGDGQHRQHHESGLQSVRVSRFGQERFRPLDIAGIERKLLHGSGIARESGRNRTGDSRAAGDAHIHQLLPVDRQRNRLPHPLVGQLGMRRRLPASDRNWS